MTDRTNWLGIPADRIKHLWTCTRSGDVAETIRRDPTGRALVVHVCTECRADDYPDHGPEAA